MARRLWSEPECSTSSIYRELLAVQTVVFQLISNIQNKTVSLFTDSKDAEIILTKGSTNIPLHKLASSIHRSLVKNVTVLIPKWMPRSENSMADYQPLYKIWTPGKSRLPPLSILIKKNWTCTSETYSPTHPTKNAKSFIPNSCAEVARERCIFVWLVCGQ